MSDLKYTPGPWVACIGKSEKRRSAVYKGDMSIACMASYMDCPDSQANARLIATAPELLNLLKHLCSEITAIERSAILHEARGVIAKATGGGE